MADVISRLKLDSGEFDSKIKRAVGGLQQMESECRKVGGTLAVLEKDQLEYVKALGRMETVSRSARGKLGELKEAFTELSVQYNRLTDEEKKGDFGKALSSSLEQLKTRIGESKNELDSIGKSLGDAGKQSQQTGGFMDELAKRFTLNIDVMKLFNVGLKAAETALSVAKDAFFKSEDNIDEWGRTVEGAKGAYDYFLDALNTGNWSNFFDNLETAINGSLDLYDALDRLGSVKANNQAAIALVQAEIQQLRLLKSQGKDVDEQIKSATKRLRDLQMGSVNAGKDAGRSIMQNVLRNSINAMGGGVNDVNINNAVNKILKEGQSAFDHFRKVAERFEKYSGAQSVRNVMAYSPTGLAYKVGEEKYFDITKLTPAQQRAYKIAKSVTMQETPLQQGIGIYAQAAGEEAAANREEFRGNRYALQRPGGGGGTGGKPEVWAPIATQETSLAGIGLHSIADVDKAINRQRGNLLNAGSYYERMDAQSAINDLEREKAFMLPNMNPFQEAFKHSFNKDIEANKKRLAREEKDKKDEKMTFQDMSAGVNQMVGGISQMTDSLEQLGIDLPEGFTAVLGGMQTIANLLSAIQAISTIKAFFSGGGVIGNAASGFVVPGNSYSGDRLRLPVAGGGMIGVNSGEVILNRAQAGVVEQEMNHSGDAGMFAMQPYVEGEKVWLGVNNYLRRSGRGEIVTARR